MRWRGDQGRGQRQEKRRRAGQGATLDEIRRGFEDAFERDFTADVFSGQRTIDDAQGAAGLLRNLISQQELKIGEELSADLLAAIFHMHRNTLTKAMNLLATEGYLQRRSGRPSRVISREAVLPVRQSKMISHTEVARRHGLNIKTEWISLSERPLSDVHHQRIEDVREALGLEDETSRVIVMSRVRSVGLDISGYTPVLAETAYFAPLLLPPFPYDELQSGELQSIATYLERNRMNVVNSKYQIRAATLPDNIVPEWARKVGLSSSAVKKELFTRLQSTTYCNQGPVEFSIAYLKTDVFSISATDLTIEFPPGPLARLFGSAGR